MIILLLILSSFFSLYVYSLLRLFALACLRKYHSKTFLKKLKKDMPWWSRFFGIYLISEKTCSFKWIKPYIIVTGVMQIGGIALINIIGLWATVAKLPMEAIKNTYVVLWAKDSCLLGLLLLLAIVNSKGQKRKR